VLIVEQFSGILTHTSRERAAEVCDTCSAALAHALDFQRIPWARFFRNHDWRSWFRRGRAAFVACSCAAVLLLAACVIPTDYLVEARGVLEPRNRRDVFAPTDGIVDELLVDHGSPVEAGQPLVVLRNPQLDLDLKRVWGELQAARKRLAAIETARVEGPNAATTTPIAAARLSGEDAELQEQVASLMRQYRLLQSHQAELNIASPITGQVLTWDLPQLLQGRPVQRGQVLMIVADPNGPWQLELEVPDRDAGHLIEARDRSAAADLAVTYLVATDPGTQHTAVVDRVAYSIERSPDGEPALRVVVKIDEDVLPNSRPGSTVIAKIHCGRRSLAFVWLHDVYYAIKTRLLF
jgi:biotin carboxyl carrier protein